MELVVAWNATACTCIVYGLWLTRYPPWSMCRLYLAAKVTKYAPSYIPGSAVMFPQSPWSRYRAETHVSDHETNCSALQSRYKKFVRGLWFRVRSSGQYWEEGTCSQSATRISDALIV
eukprot:2749059-Rhodomonas_salina.3